MEALVEKLRQDFEGRKVLVTGHTGFKGSWLVQILDLLGAEVAGISLDPLKEEDLYVAGELSGLLARDERFDIRDLERLKKVVSDFRPDFVFHLAAQALVRESYQNPIETFEVNTMGSLNLLESLRFLDQPVSCVMITTDKCYENREWIWGYRENDPMGGHDPYSASKGAAEICISAYRRSFFAVDDQVRVSTARAGNVIGGGDWSDDRIVPDCARAVIRREDLVIRNRFAKRPWQHVIEPLTGYLLQASAMNGTDDPSRLSALSEGMNFGPTVYSNRSVGELVEHYFKHDQGTWLDTTEEGAPKEATLLHLNVDKAYHLLGWKPHWDFETTVEKTASWYRRFREGESAREICRRQLEEYFQQ